MTAGPIPAASPAPGTDPSGSAGDAAGRHPLPDACPPPDGAVYRPDACPPPDGAVLRLLVGGPAWSRSLPPAPALADVAPVTVSFSSEAAAAAHGKGLTRLGYRVVGVAAAPGGDPGTEPHATADVFVPQALIDAEPIWWQALAGRAQRSFGLAFGPVAALLAEVLRLHRHP